MVICLCHRISDRDVASAARGGCASFEQFQEQTRIATACGACRDCAREVFDAHAGGSSACSGCAGRDEAAVAVEHAVEVA